MFWPNPHCTPNEARALTVSGDLSKTLETLLDVSITVSEKEIVPLKRKKKSWLQLKKLFFSCYAKFLMLKVFSNFDLPSYHRDALLLLCGNAGPTGYFKIKWGQKYLLRAICPDLWFKTGECIYRNWVGTIPQCLHLYVPSGLQWRFALHLEFLANPPPPPTRPATTSLMMAESYFKSANRQGKIFFYPRYQIQQYYTVLHIYTQLLIFMGI